MSHPRHRDEITVSKPKGSGSRSSRPKPADPRPSPLVRPRLGVGSQGREVPHTQDFSPLTAQPFPKTASEPAQPEPTAERSPALLHQTQSPCYARTRTAGIARPRQPQTKGCSQTGTTLLQPLSQLLLQGYKQPLSAWEEQPAAPGKARWHCRGLVNRKSRLHPQPHKHLCTARDLTAG